MSSSSLSLFACGRTFQHVTATCQSEGQFESVRCTCASSSSCMCKQNKDWLILKAPAPDLLEVRDSTEHLAKQTSTLSHQQSEIYTFIVPCDHKLRCPCQVSRMASDWLTITSSDRMYEYLTVVQEKAWQSAAIKHRKFSILNVQGSLFIKL